MAFIPESSFAGVVPSILHVGFGTFPFSLLSLNMQRIQARRMLPLKDTQDDCVRIDHRDRIACLLLMCLLPSLMINNGEAVDTETTTTISCELP